MELHSRATVSSSPAVHLQATCRFGVFFFILFASPPWPEIIKVYWVSETYVIQVGEIFQDQSGNICDIISLKMIALCSKCATSRHIRSISTVFSYLNLQTPRGLFWVVPRFLQKNQNESGPWWWCEKNKEKDPKPAGGLQVNGWTAGDRCSTV